VWTKANDMKPLRVFFIRFLLMIGMLGFVGCATTSATNHDTDWAEYAKQWDDMTPAQKVGTCLWWPLQVGLLDAGYALGGH